MWSADEPRTAARRARAGRAGSPARPRPWAAVYGRPSSVLPMWAPPPPSGSAAICACTTTPRCCAAVAGYDRVLPVFVLDDALLARAVPQRRPRAVDARLPGGARRGAARPRRRPDRAPGPPGGRAGAARRGRGAVDERRRRRTRAPATARVTEALSAAGVEALPHTGDVLRRRRRRRGRGTVFSAFHREWRTIERRPVLPAPERDPGRAARGDRACRRPPTLGLGPGVPDPSASRASPRPARRSTRGSPGRSTDYAERQDGMARVGTSRMAAYLRWGCVSARECEERALARGGKGAGAWVRQLAWRDFHAHSLLHHPQNVHAPQDERFRALEVEDDDERFAAWAEGRTGFPLVDAGMRELGHDRLHAQPRPARRAGRLLTKELHLDWRARRGALRAPAALRRARAEQRQLAVDRRRRHRPRAVLAPHVQPGPPPGALRPARASTSAAGSPSCATSRDDRLAEPWEMSDAEQAPSAASSAATTPRRSSTAPSSASGRRSATAAATARRAASMRL